VPPAVLVAFLVVVMTLVYFGSVVNPTGHLHGLPSPSSVRTPAGTSVLGESTSERS
jgi:hypothetical protein